MRLIQESENISRWLCEKLDGVEIPSDERARVAGGCFDIAMEHQMSFTHLASLRLFGSAFALARCVFEAYVRGTWIKQCATDEQISEFLADKFSFTFQQLIDDIEISDGYAEKILSSAKSAGWKVLNDFTHTGAQQVVRRNSDDHIEPNYSDEEIYEMQDFVNSISLLAGFETTGLSKTCTLEQKQEYLDKIKDYKTRILTMRPTTTR